MKHYLRHILFPSIIGFLIFTLTCLISSSDVPNLPPIVPWDKVMHFGMFFALSAVSFFDYFRLHDGKPKMSRWIFWGFLLPVIYGGAIELMQKHLFSSRSAELGDFIADVLGSLTALLLALFLYNKFHKKEKKVSL